MARSFPKPENLKEKAKQVRNFVKEKCGADISHSQCLELVSQLFGFKDWNTASAASKVTRSTPPVLIDSVGAMREALEPFKDSAKIEASSVFAVGALLKDKDLLGLNEKSAFFEKYSFIVGATNADAVSLILKLEDQSLGDSDGPKPDIIVKRFDSLEIN